MDSAKFVRFSEIKEGRHISVGDWKSSRWIEVHIIEVLLNVYLHFFWVVIEEILKQLYASFTVGFHAFLF